CIGNSTRSLIEGYFGEPCIKGTADNAAALAQKIIADNLTNEAYFFCGDKKREELPALLKSNNIVLYEVEVYTTTIVQHTIEKEYDGILFFSPSAVEGFFAGNTITKKTILFAIGNTTANELKKYSTNHIVITEEPGKYQL